MERHAEDDLLILCCDGIWDVFSNEDCVDHVRKTGASTGGNLAVAAEKLLDECLERGSRDNMTACLIGLPGFARFPPLAALCCRTPRPCTTPKHTCTFARDDSRGSPDCLRACCPVSSVGSAVAHQLLLEADQQVPPLPMQRRLPIRLRSGCGIAVKVTASPPPSPFLFPPPHSLVLLFGALGASRRLPIPHPTSLVLSPWYPCLASKPRLPLSAPLSGPSHCPPGPHRVSLFFALLGDPCCPISAVRD